MHGVGPHGGMLHGVPCITAAGRNVNLSQHTVFRGKSQPEDDGKMVMSSPSSTIDISVGTSV